MSLDLFICAAEMSADLHGSYLIKSLLEKNPSLKIGAIAGPKMRKLPIQTHFQMESLMVMGFIDVLLNIKSLIQKFYAISEKILQLNPKVVLFIDYPGLNLRLARRLKKKGYQGKIIHMICPSVWAWGKKRIPLMEKYLDELLAIFPFEPPLFQNSSLPTHYIGHPLVLPIKNFRPKKSWGEKKLLSIFPGSRKEEIERNLPLQLKVAKKLQEQDPSLEIAISQSKFPIDIKGVILVDPEENYELMSASYMAIATSGTVTLELALHRIPTVVTFAIRKLDCWIAQKIFRINLPFYCIVNIIENRQIFPELFGPNFSEENLLSWSEKLWFDERVRNTCKKGCEDIHKSLGVRDSFEEAAKRVLFSFPP